MSITKYYLGGLMAALLILLMITCCGPKPVSDVKPTTKTSPGSACHELPLNTDTKPYEYYGRCETLENYIVCCPI